MLAGRALQTSAEHEIKKPSLGFQLPATIPPTPIPMLAALVTSCCMLTTDWSHVIISAMAADNVSGSTSVGNQRSAGPQQGQTGPR